MVRSSYMGVGKGIDISFIEVLIWKGKMCA